MANEEIGFSRALPRGIHGRKGVSLTTVEALTEANHGAVHLHDESLIRLPDAQIAAKAVTKRRLCLPSDLDFEDILAVARSEAPIVLNFGFEIKRLPP